MVVRRVLCIHHEPHSSPSLLTVGRSGPVVLRPLHRKLLPPFSRQFSITKQLRTCSPSSKTKMAVSGRDGIMIVSGRDRIMIVSGRDRIMIMPNP